MGDVVITGRVYMIPIMVIKRAGKERNSDREDFERYLRMESLDVQFDWLRDWLKQGDQVCHLAKYTSGSKL